MMHLKSHMAKWIAKLIALFNIRVPIEFPIHDRMNVDTRSSNFEIVVKRATYGSAA
jgi:hypothetical protein